MAKIIIPTPLRKFTDNKSTLETKADTVLEAIKELIIEYPDLKNQIIDKQGGIRKFIKIYLDDTDIKVLDHEKTKVGAESVVSIIPAIAGGNIK